MNISVIMSTYYREQPQYLDVAMKSIWTDQIRKPEEIILVEDGPLTSELYAVVDKWKDQIGDVLVILKKKHNNGLAAALNDAVAIAKGDLFARMDSDDISMPDRFSLQEEYMEEHPEVDILGGALCEFNDQDTLNTVRIYPANADLVRKTMYRMSPLGHPSVMFRRRFFDEGFRYNGKYHLCEDVLLWFEAVSSGKIINNLPDILVRFRHNDSMINRRSREKAWSEFCAYNEGIHKVYGLFSVGYFYSFLRLVFRFMPVCILNGLYKQGTLRNRLSR